MRTEKATMAVILSLLFFVPSFISPKALQQEQGQKKQERKSLVLKELLTPPQKTLLPPKRNIFTRQRANTSPGEFLSEGNTVLSGQASIRQNSPEQKMAAGEAARANAQYIGYVQSGDRVVALIILEGQTYAVESGDVLEGGVTIGEITPDDLEIMDRDGQSERIRIEGE
jgi:hypothetical protein